jgi:hypothetical protein
MNQTGRLSESQAERLRVRRRRALIIGGLIVLAAAFIATGFILAGRRDNSPILTLIGIAVTICSAAATGIFARFYMRLSADLRAERATPFEGVLTRVIKPINRRVVTYLIRVGTAEVIVSKEAFMVLEHGALYRLYRTPYSGTLLSVEKLAAEP